MPGIVSHRGHRGTAPAMGEQLFRYSVTQIPTRVPFLPRFARPSRMVSEHDRGQAGLQAALVGSRNFFPSPISPNTTALLGHTYRRVAERMPTAGTTAKSAFLHRRHGSPSGRQELGSGVVGRMLRVTF